MFLCKVIGSVVATRKDDSFRTSKLLIVHPINKEGTPTGTRDMLALDPGFDAGIDDIVLVAREGAVVAQMLHSEHVPANVIILGVVDNWFVSQP